MAKPKKSKEVAVSRPERKGPFLTTALIAEKILREPDKAITAVRIVDAVGISSEGIVKDSKVGLNLWILVSFKAGGFKGDSILLITEEGPSGQSKPVGLSPIKFDGNQSSGSTVMCQVALTWDRDGLYWFDVFLDNQFVTRIPLTVTVLSDTSGRTLQESNNVQEATK